MSYYPRTRQTSRDRSSYVCLFIPPRHAEIHFSIPTPQSIEYALGVFENKCVKRTMNAQGQEGYIRVFKLCQLL